MLKKINREKIADFGNFFDGSIFNVTKRDAPLVTLKKSSKDLTVYKNKDKIE